MSNSSNKPTTVFWIISIVALIWNAIGSYFYIAMAYMTDEALAALPEAQRALIENTPAWATAAFATAVFGGLLGAVLLLLKKKLATTIFWISFIAILVQASYNLFLSNASEVNGSGSMTMPILVIIIGYFLLWYSKKATTNGWLS
jgi:CHASE2 domain-containing sensor protein